MKPVTICAIVRDEAKYIAEWIAFHQAVGVAGFIFYDDRSEDNTLDIIRKLTRPRNTIIHPYSDGWHSEAYYGNQDHRLKFYNTPQCCAYNHHARMHAGDRWAAYIDVDEYLYQTDYIPLSIALAPYERETAVAVNWLVFGSNGHESRPTDKLTIEAYVRRAKAGEPKPWGRHVKNIVNMNCAHQWGDEGSHAPVTNCSPVNQCFDRTPCSFATQAFEDGLVINHYYTRSKEEMHVKAFRVDRNAPPGYQPTLERLSHHDRNDVLDKRATYYAPCVRTRISRCV